ncbi:hypothetical protein [Thioalkalivibrio sp. AKL10]|uniref:DsrE family protein n=1 Tax=Thioalkalivibrio sp. AKL10 TaxID=1158158 RepID=UPI0003813F4D
MRHSETPAKRRTVTARPRFRLLAALACTALVGLGWNASATAFEPEAKVVYHVDYGDPQRLSSMLTSINNMMTHYQNEFMHVDVRVVFMSDGIRFTTDNNLEGTPFEDAPWHRVLPPSLAQIAHSSARPTRETRNNAPWQHR